MKRALLKIKDKMVFVVDKMIILTYIFIIAAFSAAKLNLAVTLILMHQRQQQVRRNKKILIQTRKVFREKRLLARRGPRSIWVKKRTYECLVVKVCV